MASTNLDIVRRMFTEFLEGDAGAAFDFYDPNIVWDATHLGASFAEVASVRHGHDGVRSWWRDWLEAWAGIEVVGEVQMRERGNQVVASWTQQNRGRSSGAVVEQEAALVFTFEGGVIVRVAVYPSRESAWRAVGID